MAYSKENRDLNSLVYDVEDTAKYDYLEPLWRLLEETTEDLKIPAKDVWARCKLEPDKGNPLLQELFTEFRGKLILAFPGLMSNPEVICTSWAFDKMMLINTRVDGEGVPGVDSNNPIIKMWKDRWRELRGV